jgi:transposase
MGADETGLRVAGGSGWVHVARTETHTHYGYDERRSKVAMDEIGILPQFKGMLVRDGFSSYKWYEQCQHARCEAHFLRELSIWKRSIPTRRPG